MERWHRLRFLRPCCARTVHREISWAFLGGSGSPRPAASRPLRGQGLPQLRSRLLRRRLPDTGADSSAPAAASRCATSSASTAANARAPARTTPSRSRRRPTAVRLASTAGALASNSAPRMPRDRRGRGSCRYRDGGRLMASESTFRVLVFDLGRGRASSSASATR